MLDQVGFCCCGRHGKDCRTGGFCLVWIMENPSAIDDYIATFPPATQALLTQVRATIRAAAPEAKEVMSYGIPTFDLGKVHLVHYAAFKTHIGLYATPTGHAAFAQELSVYKQGKGSVQFTLDVPLPLDLIGRIAHWRMKEVQGQLKAKAAGKGRRK
jgi:uncharacterized protein YdhG (YjbR/CyaY superfamily)